MSFNQIDGLVAWKDSFSVGNTHVDRQHKILFSIIGEIQTSVDNGIDINNLDEVLAGLKNYAETHLLDEELLMRQSKFPGYEAHVQLHKEFTIEVNNVFEKYQKGICEVEDILSLVKNWLINHICTVDREYIPYLKNIVIEVNEADKLYSDPINLSLKAISFSEEDLRLFKQAAKLLNKNKDRIIKNWQKLEEENYRKYPILRESLESLLDDFIESFTEKSDTRRYLNKNELMGGNIAARDIPYHVFMQSFHHWEISIQDIIVKHFKKNFLHVISTLDCLHHNTMSILANQYFNVRDTTIFALAKLADSRDPETGNHLMRTREYSRIIAEELDCSDEFVENIYKVSPLHDIGKVGICDDILLKSGPLTEEEFEKMKEHVDIGGRTLNAIIGKYRITKGHLIIAEEIAKYHHEKFNGKGYKGLKGSDIPLSARIFCLGDIYDALTSKRCYKEAFTHEKACSIILEGDGRTNPEDFDPKVLFAFERAKDDFFKVSQRYKN